MPSYPSEEKSVQTSLGAIPYTLTRKKVKNLNLRINSQGEVGVSAPVKMPQKTIDAFLMEKAGWIIKNKSAIQARPASQPCLYSKQECLELFSQISDRIYPLFQDILRGQKPEIKVRDMKTRWGVCHISKRTITLNTRLAEQPYPAIEYVILHEYVHFLHPNHQAGFHGEMARLMPDYRQRRKLLGK